jgi:hypothetical protein
VSYIVGETRHVGNSNGQPSKSEENTRPSVLEGLFTRGRNGKVLLLDVRGLLLLAWRCIIPALFALFVLLALLIIPALRGLLLVLLELRAIGLLPLVFLGGTDDGRLRTLALARFPPSALVVSQLLRRAWLGTWPIRNGLAVARGLALLALHASAFLVLVLAAVALRGALFCGLSRRGLSRGHQCYKVADAQLPPYNACLLCRWSRERQGSGGGFQDGQQGAGENERGAARDDEPLEGLSAASQGNGRVLPFLNARISPTMRIRRLGFGRVFCGWRIGCFHGSATLSSARAPSDTEGSTRV